MKAKHTPGPWYALRGQRNISIRHKTGDKFLPMVNVASVRGKFPADCPYGSSEANARLIAAAPELLEAAIELKDVCNRPSAARTRAEAWRKLDKAIAKALQPNAAADSRPD